MLKQCMLLKLIAAAIHMNPFVNEQEREVGLPGGCVDLIEVLQSTKPALDSTSTWRMIPGLMELERFLAALLLKPNNLRAVCISPSKMEGRIDINRVHEVLQL